jgi:hypothetical protein
MGKTIELLWHIATPNREEKYESLEGKGIYQIYGTHPIYGRNVLLYIGMTVTDINIRLKKHKYNWLKHEYDPVTIYIGKLAPTSEFASEVDSSDIRKAEALLIYYCAPAYNSSSLSEIKENLITDGIVVRNYGKIGSLPTEVSTMWYDSKVWDDEYFNK